MILPSLELVLHTTLSPTQAAQALQSDLVAERDGAQLTSRDIGPWRVGTLAEPTFECVRDKDIRHSLLTRIKGTLRPDAQRGGSHVALDLSVQPLLAVYLYCWLGLVTLGGVSTAMAALRSALSGDGGVQVMGWIMPLWMLGMLVLSLALLRWMFGHESAAAVAFVKSKLSAQALEPPAR
jgi:hypothetical protein